MTTLQTLALSVNGKEFRFAAPPTMTLLEYLRDELGLTGAKRGCGYGACGACTVLIDGEPSRACITRLSSLSGKQVETIEGLEHAGRLDPVQEAFLDQGVFQCGYCTPGMIMEVRGFLRSLGGRVPRKQEIEAALESHICRCGSYQRLCDAVAEAAARIQRGTAP